MTRNVGLVIVGLSVFVAAACDSATRRGPAAGQPDDEKIRVNILTFSMSPAKTRIASLFARLPLGENIAVQLYATSSAGDDTGLLTADAVAAELAIDGDTASVWSSQQPAPQWFSVHFDDLYLVNRKELVITQASAGPTTQEIWLSNGSGTRTLFNRLAGVRMDGNICF